MKVLNHIFLYFVLIGFNPIHSAAQNLIPNFSFEINDTCPNSGDQIQYATGWNKVCTMAFTPDYYNGCSSSTAAGVPQSIFLYQNDNRGCNAYAGLITWSPLVNEREQIGIQLSQPLTIGQKYYLSFYTVRGGLNDNSDCPSNNIGMRFSTVAYSSSNPAPIDNFAHLRAATVISDTANWVRISGSIIADSAYNYVMLGNFYDDSNTDTTTLTCGTCSNNYSYYLIDDICVSTDSSLCNGGIDALPCIVSVEENSLENNFLVFPNPASDFINIINKNYLSSFKITIYNALGQVSFTQQKITPDNLHIDISSYNTGLFFIKIESITQSIIYKLIKQ